MPEIVWFEKLESTRTKLEEFMETDLRPLIVVAEEQFNGRGQVGKSWDSPKGNLYCSFSVLIQDDHILSKISLLPLLVAYVLRETLQSYYELPLTIKWPNDLLLDGKKIGGILCEAQSKSSSVDWISIGFGLNLSVSGATSQYASTCLAEYRKIDASKKAVEESLLQIYQNLDHYLLEFTPDIARPKWLEFLHDYQLNRILFDTETEQLYRVTGLGDDGHLRVESLGSPAVKRSLYSANHSFKLLSQSDSLPRVYVDIGNTAAKIFLFVEDSHSVLTLDHLLSDSERNQKIKSFFAKCSKTTSFVPAWCASVNPQAFLKLKQELLELAKVSLESIAKKRVFTRGAYDLNTLGVDRLCLVEGAARRLMPLGRDVERVAVVVSLGTATTIDAIDNTGKHLGGIILPGLATSLEALALKGALLPKQNLMQYVRSFDSATRYQTTESAMVEGCLHATVGSISSFLQNLHITDQKVFLAGGFATLVKEYLTQSQWQGTEDWVVDTELLLSGLQTMALNPW